MASAVEYRKRVIPTKVSCPRIVTLDGKCVESVRYKLPAFEKMQRQEQSMGVDPIEIKLEKKLLREQKQK